jgi:uncharacterized protein (TIGR00106 family)
LRLGWVGEKVKGAYRVNDCTAIGGSVGEDDRAGVGSEKVGHVDGRQTQIVTAEERNRMVLLEFSMSPLGKGESVSKYVSRSLDIIDKSGVSYRLNPMGTVLEGEWDEVFGVVRQCYERMKKDCNRISCSIKVDFRKGHSGRLVSKVASVEKILKRSIKQ